jgi:hypothetical protein
MANISMALETAEDCGVKVTCSAQDVHDMNTKLVLGFIWSLITKFQTGARARSLVSVVPLTNCGFDEYRG